MHCGGIWLNTDILCSTLSADTLPKSELTVYIASNLSATNTDPHHQVYQILHATHLILWVTFYSALHQCNFGLHCAVQKCAFGPKKFIFEKHVFMFKTFHSNLSDLYSLNKLSIVIFSDTALHYWAIAGGVEVLQCCCFT